MKNFANSLKPVFPHSFPDKYRQKNRLVLCLDENETDLNKDKALGFDSIPDEATIYRALKQDK